MVHLLLQTFKFVKQISCDLILIFELFHSVADDIVRIDVRRYHRLLLLQVVISNLFDHISQILI